MFDKENFTTLINEYHSLSEKDRGYIDDLVPLELNAEVIIGMIKGICLGVGAALVAHPRIIEHPAFIIPVKDVLGCLLAHLSEEALAKLAAEISVDFAKTATPDFSLSKSYEV